MRLTQLAVLICLSFVLQGCATLVAKSPDPTAQIDTWIKNHKYDKALSTIAAMSPEHIHYEKQKDSVADIKRKREKYIRSVMAHAKEYEPQQDWINALNVIENALERLPRSPELQAQYEYYEAKRKNRVNNDEAAILIAKAQYIIDSRPYQESKLYNADSSFFAQQEFNNYTDQASQVSRNLYVIGQRYWQEGKAVQARNALSLSIQTAENELSSELLTEVIKQQDKDLAANHRKQKVDSENQIAPLESEFNRHLRADNFVAAQITLNEIRALNYGGTANLQNQLNEQKNRRVETLITSGNTLYNSGHIQAAIEQWHLALALAPKNQTILQQLTRAERFIDNLQRWKGEPQ